MKIQWEYELVEKPFCQQLKSIGRAWLEGDTDVPELTEYDGKDTAGALIGIGVELEAPLSEPSSCSSTKVEGGLAPGESPGVRDIRRFSS